MRPAAAFISTFAALTALMPAVAPTASARPFACAGAIVADARMPNGLNYDPPRHYDTQALARARAITAWQLKARAACGHPYGYWPLARDKSVSCEGYAGGIGCTVRAMPARS